MFLKAQLQWNILIPAENLDANGQELKQAIAIRLFNEFAATKATSELYYLIAVTTLDHIGDGIVQQQSGEVRFHVKFTCITYKVFKGEILNNAEVHQILPHGLFLKCGPYDNIYLSLQKMQGYSFVSAENPYFRSEQKHKIEKGIKLRVMVIGARYIYTEKEFQVVVSMDGDLLGPVV